MEKENLHLSEWFEQGFRLYRQNLPILISATFIALLLSVATAGVLAGPLLVGLLMILLGLKRKQAPRPETLDLFKGFRFFLNAAIFVMGWGMAVSVGAMILIMIPGIGPLVALFFIYGAKAVLMFGPFLILDQGMDFREATITSFSRVKEDFWIFLSVSAAAGVIGSLGLVLLGIGIVLTVPLQLSILTVAYDAVFGKKDPMR